MTSPASLDWAARAREISERRAQSGERLLLGSSWYPEMWPEAEWSKDVAKMRELGFTAVRLFEFAWAKLEPEEGRFDFGWAHRVLDLCTANGLAAQIGTPTAAPPIWLTEKYPEVLRTGPHGRPAQHGGRCHYNFHHPKYVEKAAAVAGAMAQALNRHACLHSWQVDNEMSGSDFSAGTLARFHEWLRARYGTVAALNEAWGLEFWSQRYGRFEQIQWPAANPEHPDGQGRPHPSLALAIKEFQNEGWTAFIAAQVMAIRAHSKKPVTANMTDSASMNWFKHNALVDRVGFSLYRDAAHYHYNLRNFDRMRAEKDAPYYFPETAPNWSGGGPIWNIHLHDKGVQAVTWMSVFLGGSMVLYWQWRQHWAGQEINHGTHVNACGQWRPNREAWARLASQFKQVGQWLMAHPPAPAPVALLESNEAGWVFESDTMAAEGKFDYRGILRDDFHVPLVEAQLWRDVVGLEADFARYRVVLAPLQPILPAATRERLAAFVEGGGHLVLGPVTGIRTTEFTVFRDREFGGLEDLAGVDSALGFTAVWQEDKIRVVFGDGSEARCAHWCEAFRPRPGTEVLANYEGGYGDGLPAITRRLHPSGGSVTFLGCRLDRAAWTRLILATCARAGVHPVGEAEPGVIIVPRADWHHNVRGWAVLNYTDQLRHVRLPLPGGDLLHTQQRPAEFPLGPFEAALVVPNRETRSIFQPAAPR